MKKVVSILFVVMLMVVCLVGCGESTEVTPVTKAKVGVETNEDTQSKNTTSIMKKKDALKLNNRKNKVSTMEHLDVEVAHRDMRRIATLYIKEVNDNIESLDNTESQLEVHIEETDEGIIIKLENTPDKIDIQSNLDILNFRIENNIAKLELNTSKEEIQSYIELSEEGFKDAIDWDRTEAVKVIKIDNTTKLPIETYIEIRYTNS